MFFTAIVSKSGQVSKENLDSFNELQEFAAKKINEGFINLEVRAFKSNGACKIIEYVETLGAWEKVRELVK